jgi:large subunit ribosomal protein L15
MPMQRRFPKKGFKNPFRAEVFAVNVGSIEKRFSSGVVDLAALQNAGMVPRSRTTVKILGEGDLKKKLTVKATFFSASAKQKIEAAGGTAEVIATRAAARAAE